MLQLCLRFQLCRNTAGNIIEVDWQDFLLEAVIIQTGKPDDILDQRDHSAGFIADFLCKAVDVLRLDHARADHIRNAVDRGERRFQLVRDIGCKFAAERIALFPLGDIQQHQHRALGEFITGDWVCNQLTDGLPDRQCRFTVDSLDRIGDHVIERRAVIKVVNHAVFSRPVRIQQPECCMVA